MKTFKKSAVSNDNPEYLLRNKFMLLHQNATSYFPSSERSSHKIALPKLGRVVNIDAKFGMSEDSPHIAKYSVVNHKTNSIIDTLSPRINKSPIKVVVVSPHTCLRDCFQESKGNTNTFNKILRTKTREHLKRPRKKIFSLMMRRSASQEDKIKQSFLSPNNAQNLRFSMIKNEDSPYAKKLAGFTSKISKRSSSSMIQSPNNNSRKSEGFAFMLTETHAKNPFQ